jgi:Leucine-rich repeat (LRR) protein
MKSKNIKGLIFISLMILLSKNTHTEEAYSEAIRPLAYSMAGSENDKEIISYNTKKSSGQIKAYEEYFHENFDENNSNVYLVDLTHDERDEMIVSASYLEDIGYTRYEVNIYTYKNNKVTNIEFLKGYEVHISGFLDLYVLKINGKYYLMHITSKMWQGYGWIKYEIYSFDKNGKKIIYKQDRVEGEPVSDKAMNKYEASEQKWRKYVVYTIQNSSSYLSNVYRTPSNIFNKTVSPTPTPKVTSMPGEYIFKDKTVESYIRKELKKEQESIKKKDLLKINKLYISEEKINSIDDLAYCKNLKELSLFDCQITDISAISSLTKMESLNLCYNHIEKLDAVKKMYNLKELYIYGCLINDFSGIANLVKLENIVADHNTCENTSAFKKLVNLENLSLVSNNISKIDSLKGLKKLTNLDLAGNQIKDINAIKAMTNLETLVLRYNQIVSIKPLEYLSKLTTLDLENNKISNIKPLKNLKKLKSVNLYDNPITDWSAVDHVPQVSGR